MTPRDRRLLRDIVENASIATSSSSGVEAELFDKTPALKYTTLYALQIVGEAAGKLSDEIKAKLPHIPWDEIVATRHVIVHGYDKVNPRAIIAIAQDDLPPLVDAILNLLRLEGSGS